MVSGTNSGYILVLAIVLFSLGEMLNGPKKLELFDLALDPGETKDIAELYPGPVETLSAAPFEASIETAGLTPQDYVRVVATLQDGREIEERHENLCDSPTQY